MTSATILININEGECTSLRALSVLHRALVKLFLHASNPASDGVIIQTSCVVGKKKLKVKICCVNAPWKTLFSFSAKHPFLDN